MKSIEIIANGAPLSATLFEVAGSNTVLIISSATGVKQAYYQKFAQYAADRGITVITFDYQSIGGSRNKPVKDYQIEAADWSRNDLEGVIQYVMSHYPDARKVILGHSIGGQLIGLAKSAPLMDQLVLVAAQSGYWKYWKGFGKVKMWFNWYVLFPAVLWAFGYLKAKQFSSMENLPYHVANQWRNWGKHVNYLMSDPSITEKFYHHIQADLTAFSIDDDDLAPRGAVQWMTSQYRNASSKSIHLKPEDFQTNKIGHFGVFKEKFQETIWPLLLKEVK